MSLRNALRGGHSELYFRGKETIASGSNAVVPVVYP